MPAVSFWFDPAAPGTSALEHFLSPHSPHSASSADCSDPKKGNHATVTQMIISERCQITVNRIMKDFDLFVLLEQYSI